MGVFLWARYPCKPAPADPSPLVWQSDGKRKPIAKTRSIHARMETCIATNTAAMCAPPPGLCLSRTWDSTPRPTPADQLASLQHALKSLVSITQPPPSPLRQLDTSGTLVQIAGFRHPAHFGQLNCHRLDELLPPNLRIENHEARARLRQHLFTPTGQVLHRSLVLAHHVEQSAHIPRGLFTIPACLKTAEGSTSVCVFSQACGNLCQTDVIQSCWRQGPCSVKGFPTRGGQYRGA